MIEIPGFCRIVTYGGRPCWEGCPGGGWFFYTGTTQLNAENLMPGFLPLKRPVETVVHCPGKGLNYPLNTEVMKAFISSKLIFSTRALPICSRKI